MSTAFGALGLEPVTPVGVPAFDRRRAVAPLVITNTQLRMARSNKAACVIWLDPGAFLRLTLSAEDVPGRTIDPNLVINGKPSRALDEYNAYSAEGNTLIMPFLYVELVKAPSPRDGTYRVGSVTGHEGRHRALAVLRERPGEPIGVAINLRAHGYSQRTIEAEGFRWGRPVTAADMPRTLYGEFNPAFAYAVPASAFTGALDLHDPDLELP